MHFGYTFHLFIATAKMKNSETTEKHKKKYQRKTFSLASTKYAGWKKKRIPTTATGCDGNAMINENRMDCEEWDGVARFIAKHHVKYNIYA